MTEKSPQKEKQIETGIFGLLKSNNFFFTPIYKTKIKLKQRQLPPILCKNI